MKFPPFLIAASLVTLAHAEPAATKAPSVTDFIRVTEDDSAARLQTAVTRYQKGRVSVDLIGAVHIADAKYYAALNQRFTTYEALLFEMIGGRQSARAKTPAGKAATKPAAEKVGKKPPATDNDTAPDADTDDEADPQNLAMIHQMYGLVSGFLGLTDQMSHVDYRKKNFVHADLSLAEFERLQAERGESILSFALEAGKKAEATGTTKQPDMQRLMMAVLAGNPNSVKLEIVHTLGAGDDQIAAFTGKSVIISDRNAKCLQVLGKQVAAGRKKLGIFYGAAHFPDMEKRLQALGYQRVAQEWMTAWDTPKAKKDAAPAAPKQST